MPGWLQARRERRMVMCVEHLGGSSSARPVSANPFSAAPLEGPCMEVGTGQRAARAEVCEGRWACPESGSDSCLASTLGGRSFRHGRGSLAVPGEGCLQRPGQLAWRTPLVPGRVGVRWPARLKQGLQPRTSWHPSLLPPQSPLRWDPGATPGLLAGWVVPLNLGDRSSGQVAARGVGVQSSFTSRAHRQAKRGWHMEGVCPGGVGVTPRQVSTDLQVSLRGGSPTGGRTRSSRR